MLTLTDMELTVLTLKSNALSDMNGAARLRKPYGIKCTVDEAHRKIARLQGLLDAIAHFDGLWAAKQSDILIDIRRELK